MKMLTRVNSAIFWGFLELRKGEQNVLYEHKHNRRQIKLPGFNLYKLHLISASIMYSLNVSI